MLKLIKITQRLSGISQPVVLANRSNIQNLKYIPKRCVHDDQSDKPGEDKNISHPTAVTSKYEIFRDENATVILDVEEEREKLNTNVETEESVADPFEGLNLKRGKTGVYDIADLVQVLQRDNAQDIFVCSVPKEFKYVDYMCVVHGRSLKHMQAMAEFAVKMYKMKKSPRDRFIKVEGANSQEWMALDMGNIALHIFSKPARTHFDLESLWSVGSQYDKESLKKTADDLVELYDRHTEYLFDLKSFERPAEDAETPFDKPDISTPFDEDIEIDDKIQIK